MRAPLPIVAIGIAIASPCIGGSTTNDPAPPSTGILEHQSRLDWNVQTLGEDYKRYGHHSSKWDGPAESALLAYAQVRSTDTVDSNLVARVKSESARAVSLGCDDPLINYVCLRYSPEARDRVALATAEKFGSIAEALETTKYAPIRKYYAALRVAEAYNSLGSSGARAEVHKWRNDAQRQLVEVARDKSTPGIEMAQAWERLLHDTPKNSRDYDAAYFDLESIVFENWPSEPGLLLIKGKFYTDYAWEARGSGLARSVTDQGWASFGERLEIAEAALTSAWKLDPHDARIAREMITVELGQGRGRERMETWFSRAMALNTNYYEACYSKLNYLQPKWYGSREAMLDFGSECLDSTNWGGHVPLIVLDVHDIISQNLNPEDKSTYYERPEVWSDIKRALDKFFRLNPDATGWHHNYALYAYKARQWTDLNRELGLLGKINYDYFGGQAEFEKIVQAAKDHAPSGK